MFTILVASPTGDPINDRQQIQDAVNQVHAAGGGQVSLRPGDYAVNKAIDLQDNVILRGSGRHATTIHFGGRPSTGPDDLYRFWHSVIRVIGKKNTQICDLRVDGRKCYRRDAAQPEGSEFRAGIAVRAAGMTDNSSASGQPWSVDNSQVMNGESRDCIISSCVIENCRGSGLVIEGAREITVIDCEARNNDDFGFFAGAYTHFCRFIRCTARRNHHGAIELLGARHHLVEDCILSNIVLQSFGGPAQPTYHRIRGCTIGPNHAGDPVVVNGQSFVTVEGCTIIADAGSGVNVFCAGLPGDVPARTEPDLKALARGIRISGNIVVGSPLLTRSLITRISRELQGAPFNFVGNLRQALQDTFEALVKIGVPANSQDPVDPVMGTPPPHLPVTPAETTIVNDALQALSNNNQWTWATSVDKVQMIVLCIAFEAARLPRFLLYSPLLPNGATSWEAMLNFLPDEFFDPAPAVESSFEVQYPWDVDVGEDKCRKLDDDRGRYGPGPAGIALRYVIDSVVSGNRVVGLFPVGILLHLSRSVSVEGNVLTGSDQWHAPSTSGLTVGGFVSGHAQSWPTANRPFEFGVFVMKTLGSSITANVCRGFEYGIHEGVTWSAGEPPWDPNDPLPEVGHNFVLDNRLEENNHAYGTKQLTTSHRDF